MTVDGSWVQVVHDDLRWDLHVVGKKGGVHVRGHPPAIDFGASTCSMPVRAWRFAGTRIGARCEAICARLGAPSGKQAQLVPIEAASRH